MLSKETIQQLGKILPEELSAETLAKAITSNEEVVLDIPNGKFYSESQKEQLLENYGKSKYYEYKQVGEEIMLKNLSKKIGLETAMKDPDKFLDTFKSQVLETAKVEPNKKISDLENSLSVLQKKYETDIANKENELLSYNSKIKAIEQENRLKGISGDLISGITPDVTITMFNKEFEQKEDGIYRNGILQKNDVEAPLKLEDVYSSFLQEKNWIKQQPTGNGGNTPQSAGAKPKSYDEFVKHCESKGINPASMQGRELARELAKENPEFNN